MNSVSTRDGRRTDDTGCQAWESLPFLYKLCSILSGIVDLPKARSLVIQMKEYIDLQGVVTAADFRGPGVKHIYGPTYARHAYPSHESDWNEARLVYGESREKWLTVHFSATVYVHRSVVGRQRSKGNEGIGVCRMISCDRNAGSRRPICVS